MNDKIIALMRDNAFVNRALAYHIKGDVSYEQALEMAVIALAEVNKTQQDKLLKCTERLLPQQQSSHEV